MRFTLSICAVTLLIVVTGCRDSTVHPMIDLDAVYERTDRDFDRAVLFRPSDATEGQPAHLFAPLILVENGESGSLPPEVTFERTEDGWLYRWTSPDSGIIQGIYATLGDDGFPLSYEVLHDSSGARLLFVDTTLEQRAAQQFGPPLADRRFALERDLGETPDIAIGAVFEPGATPLGPFVYVWEASGDVNIVLCRCMAPRVFDISDSIAYTLEPHEPSDWRPLSLGDSLRLPSDQ